MASGCSVSSCPRPSVATLGIVSGLCCGVSATSAGFGWESVCVASVATPGAGPSVATAASSWNTCSSPCWTSWRSHADTLTDFSLRSRSNCRRISGSARKRMTLGVGITAMLPYRARHGMVSLKEATTASLPVVITNQTTTGLAGGSAPSTPKSKRLAWPRPNPATVDTRGAPWCRCASDRRSSRCGARRPPRRACRYRSCCAKPWPGRAPGRRRRPTTSASVHMRLNAAGRARSPASGKISTRSRGG